MTDQQDPLNIAEKLLRLPVAEALDSLKSAPPSTAMYYFCGGVLAVDYHWIALRPILLKKNSEGEVKSFLNELWERKNVERRREIVLGRKLVNRLFEVDLLVQLKEIDPENEPHRCQVLVKRLKEFVEDGGLDTRQIEKTIDEVKNERGEAYHGDQAQVIWQAFCDHVARNKSIPTKKELRDSISLDIPASDFTKKTTMLGLKGLPEAKRTS
jgi:hypothetical protein